MLFNGEGGYSDEVRSYYLPGYSPAPPPEHRVHVSTTNAEEKQVNLTLCYFHPAGVVLRRRV